VYTVSQKIQKREMVESSSIIIREGDKLKGMANYYVWALKMRAILRTENQWSVITKE